MAWSGARAVRRITLLGAACLGLTLMTAPAVGAAPGAVPFDGKSPRALVNEIQRYWALTMPKQYGRRFDPVPASRVRGVSPNSVGAFPCAEGLSWEEVRNNAIGGACADGPIVVWDGTPTGILAQIRRTFGPAAVGFVFAHEFGHVVQQQLGIHRSSVLMEQQADCFAGAFTAWSNDHGRVAMVRSPEDMDQITRGMLLVRDQPGSSSHDEGAHGSGFDRVRALQDGIIGGLKACKAYTTRLPRLFQTTFRSQDEADSGGNLGYDDLIATVLPTLNEYFTTSEPGFTPVTLGDVATLADTSPCDVTVPWVTLCPADRTLYLSVPEIRRLHAKVGDGSTVAVLALAMSQANVPAEFTGSTRYMWDACRAGNFFRLEAGNGDATSLSPGDLDEVLEFLLKRNPATPAGTPTMATIAFRAGFFGQRETCVTFARDFQS